MPQPDASVLLAWMEKMCAVAFTCRRLRDRGEVDSAIVEAALLRSLEVIGQVMKDLPDDFPTHAEARGNHRIAWRGFIGMRDRLAHAYFSVDLDIVWASVDTELVELASSIPLLMQIAEENYAGAG